MTKKASKEKKPRKPRHESKKVLTKEEKEQQKKLEKALATVSKRFGKDAVVKFTGEAVKGVETVSTRSQELDDLLTGETDKSSVTIAGSGRGFPRGRIMEVYGAEASGKTTLTLKLVRAAQKAGGVCAFIDAEHALDLQYTKKLKVRVDDLYLTQPNSGEEAIDILFELVGSGAFMVIVVDSVAGLVPQVELDKKSVGDSVVAVQARLMSKALRRLAMLCNKTGTTVIFTNQTRQKIGVFFGNPNTTPGGQALKFWASIRLEIVKMKTLKKAGRAYGHRARIRAVKNKVAPPFRDVFADVIPNKGFKTWYSDPGFGTGKDKDDE